MNEVMIVEVEMKARDALTQFEKLDAQFRETSGNNKQLYQELWRQHKKYVGDVGRENKKRAADEAWLTREMNKEVRERSKNEQWLSSELKKEVRQQAADDRWLARELEREEEKRKKAIIARSKDEQWLTRELAKEQKQRERDAERAARETERANQKTSRFGGGMGSGGVSDKIFAAYAAVDAARGLATLADRGFRAADSLRGVHRGLETVYGSAERAAERFKELNELAKLPGLDPEPLARFDAIFKNLGSTAKQNEILFTGLAKSVTTFGGDVFGVSSALYQLSQGFAKNKIDAQDFKSISEQTGGTFMKTAKEVLGFTGGIEGMREAFKASGQTLQDFLMPVFVQLNKEFQGAPVDSYTNAIDNLGVAFKNLTAEMFSNASFVGKFLSHLTGFIEGEKELWNEMRTGGEAIKAVGDESELSAAKLQILQKDFGRVSTELTNVQEKYDALKEKGIHPATASLEQLQRRIDFLSERKQALSANVNKAKTSVTGFLKPVKNINEEFKVLKVDIDTVDTRFMTFTERGAALKGVISELPPELTKVREGLSESTTWAENLEKQFDALRGSTERVYDVFVDLNAGLDNYIEKAEQAWQASREPLTDISGAQRQAEDFTAAQRRLHQPADIENNRRSYATSPRRNYRGTQSDAFLGITGKVREFEQVTDISIDKLDEFSAQTQHTAKELQKLNQKELAEFSKSLFDIVNAVDTLTPALEGFGLDMTSQRSHGRLAVNAAAGVGQVLTGDVFGGLSNIIMSMWEWGQPSREALTQQHEAALEGERQRVARIQRELDAYDAQRENLFAGRMDFLMHGESTFSDWTDTLKSFSDHDLKRGQQVFASFSEAMDAFNNEANQARLKLAPTAASARYNLYQKLKNRDHPQGHQTTRAEADATALASGMTTPEEIASEYYPALEKIHKDHTEKKKEIDAKYAERTQQLYQNLVDQVRDIQADLTQYIADQQDGLAERNAERLKEIERLEKESLSAQKAAHQEYAATMENLYRDMVDQWNDLEDGYKQRYKDRQQEIVDILKAAVDERVEIEKAASKATEDAWAEYHAEIGRIATELVDAINEINAEIVEITQDSVAEIAKLESDAVDDRAALYDDHQDKIAAIEARRIEQFAAFQERLVEIETHATERRAAASATLAEKQENINRGVVDRITAIHESLAETIAGLNENSVDLEQDRLDSIHELNKSAKEKLEDLERDKSRTLEDLAIAYDRKMEDLNFKRYQALKKISEDESLSEEEKEKKKFEIVKKYDNLRGDLNIANLRKRQDLDRDLARDQADIERETAAQTIDINEETAEKQSEIGEQRVDATATAAEKEGEVETDAGISFEDAQAVYVPALSAHEQALKEHTEALNAINAAEIEAKAELDADALTATQEYFEALKTETAEYNKNLTEINTELKNNTKAVKDDTAARIKVLEDRKTGLETGAGMTYQEALALYQEKLPANTEALNRLNETLKTIDTNRTGALGTLQGGTTSAIADVNAADATDRADTTAAQQTLETLFGVDIQTAMDNYVPKLNLAAAASKTLSEALTSINTSLVAGKEEIARAGILDASTVSELVKTATMQAASDILKFEGDFGTTFAEALSHYIPEPSLMAELIAEKITETAALTADTQGQVNQFAPNINVTVIVDSEQIVTPRFAEKVSDQLSVNAQSGAGRR